MTVPNYTPYARETLPGERRPIAWEGGEWLEEFPRRHRVHFTLSAIIGLSGLVGVVGFVAFRVFG